jgi:hypothetical protein
MSLEEDIRMYTEIAADHNVDVHWQGHDTEPTRHTLREEGRLKFAAFLGRVRKEARKGLNRRHGFRHNHSGVIECGIAYVDTALGPPEGQGVWLPCSKRLNHEGACGYADNSAY